jgi:hypothetical protein
MWKDPNIILNYDNFWSQAQLFPDYVVPPAPESSLQQYEKGHIDAMICLFHNPYLNAHRCSMLCAFG